MGNALTTGILIVLFWAAVIIISAIVYEIVKSLRPDFDKRLWKK